MFNTDEVCKAPFTGSNHHDHPVLQYNCRCSSLSKQALFLVTQTRVRTQTHDTTHLIMGCPTTSRAASHTPRLRASSTQEANCSESNGGCVRSSVAPRATCMCVYIEVYILCVNLCVLEYACIITQSCRNSLAYEKMNTMICTLIQNAL
jgi:hypothetical protein